MVNEQQKERTPNTDGSGDCMGQSTNGSGDAYFTSPTDFAGADDIFTNFVKEREPGIEIIEHTP